MEKKQREKIENLLVEIKKFKLNMEEGVESATEAENKFKEIKATIDRILDTDKDSREYKLFRNWYNSDADLQWARVPRPGGKIPTENKKIDSIEEILRKIIEKKDKKEISFSKNEEFQALNYLRKILKEAQNKIIIIDGYLDDAVFDLIEDIDEKVQISLLTHDKKPIFSRLFLAFSQNNSNVEAVINNSSHDRYIIIDDKFFYHIGASFNTIGKSDFMINEIETEEEKTRKLINFNDWWGNGTKIN